jgi:hypothetical protein
MKRDRREGRESGRESLGSGRKLQVFRGSCGEDVYKQETTGAEDVSKIDILDDNLEEDAELELAHESGCATECGNDYDEKCAGDHIIRYGDKQK